MQQVNTEIGWNDLMVFLLLTDLYILKNLTKLLNIIKKEITTLTEYNYYNRLFSAKKKTTTIIAIKKCFQVLNVTYQCCVPSSQKL